jgi:hypothetical protein
MVTWIANFRSVIWIEKEPSAPAVSKMLSLPVLSRIVALDKAVPELSVTRPLMVKGSCARAIETVRTREINMMIIFPISLLMILVFVHGARSAPVLVAIFGGSEAGDLFEDLAEMTMRLESDGAGHHAQRFIGIFQYGFGAPDTHLFLVGV